VELAGGRLLPGPELGQRGLPGGGVDHRRQRGGLGRVRSIGHDWSDSASTACSSVGWVGSAAMGQIVEFPNGDDTASGYLSVPDSGSGPGLIVIQEWWGLVDHIKDVCDRFAGEGFVALAPDLYHGETTTEP